jgi:VWFA-related protein
MHLLNRPAVFLLILLPALLAAQATPPQEGDATFRAETRLVLLHATVVDKDGRLNTNLNREAFRVFEDGVEQTLRIFRREDVPVSLGLVVDNSGSMRDKRRRVEAAAVALVKASNPQDEVFIVNFNDEAFLDVPFTNDIKKMEEGLTRIDSRGGTAMRDSLVMSIDHLKEKGKRDKKVILLITDGDDTASSIDLERALTRVQQSEVLVYSVGILSEEDKREARRAKKALDTLTKASGGQAYYPKQQEEVEKLCLEVAHEIRNQYILAYSPTLPDDGKFRQIRVVAKGPNNPTVRTRTGYYAGTPISKSTPPAPPAKKK